MSVSGGPKKKIFLKGYIHIYIKKKKGENQKGGGKGGRPQF